MKHALLCFLFFNLSVLASSEIEPQALSRRLLGVPLLLSDARYETIRELLKSGKKWEAAQILTQDKFFYQNTVRNLASTLSSRTESPSEPLNDATALFVGITRDERDARELLTADYRYEAKLNHSLAPISIKDNRHFEMFSEKNLSLKDELVRVFPQWNGKTKAAGFLTTRAWAQSHYQAGTNRRATEYAFREFACAPIEMWKTPNLPDMHIRRDVDRAPGMDPGRFETECRTCHAALDGMSGAFASLDFRNLNTFVYQEGWIAPKYNQNNDVYPPGYQTRDSSWINLLSSSAHQDTFGWRGPMEGVGIKSFGIMLAESKAFSVCLVKRVFKKICRRELKISEQAYLQKMALDFEKGGYRLRNLFEKTAISEECYL